MEKELLKRALESDDWLNLRDIRLHALKTHPEVYGSNFADENKRSEQDWRGLLSSESMRVFGAFHGQNLVGIAAAYDWRFDQSGKSASLGMWYMNPAYRKTGAFVDLVRLSMDWAKAQKRYERIVVSHRVGNETSKSVNQKLGFHYFMTRSDHWPDGQTADNIFYELRITR